MSGGVRVWSDLVVSGCLVVSGIRCGGPGRVW